MYTGYVYVCRLLLLYGKDVFLRKGTRIRSIHILVLTVFMRIQTHNVLTCIPSIEKLICRYRHTRAHYGFVRMYIVCHPPRIKNNYVYPRGVGVPYMHSTGSTQTLTFPMGIMCLYIVHNTQKQNDDYLIYGDTCFTRT